ncbi:IS110 family transposase [Mariniflexile soesokkakense]|uniref:IS110 family transposase n=1 Tax=Mariniflexile soesokkakense TaxID=1343160 RepID=A0ABV0AG23_9FLAO
MNENTNYFGIDISKDVFDVMGSDGLFHQFGNELTGFKKFIKLMDCNSHCVMESTGVYHLRLAYYLIEHNIKVSVENPLSVKRFIQMKLSKIKTDKSDSKMIYEYAIMNSPSLWTGQTKSQIECSHLLSLSNLYTKEIIVLKNKLHSEEAQGSPVPRVIRSINRSLNFYQKEIETLEITVLKLVKQEYRDLHSRIKSIPGLGAKASALLIVLTDGFERFNTASELCSFAGLTPIIRESGSSIRSRPRISKMGNRRLRKILFICSFSASKHNKACRELYNRIVAKGKSKKLALVAVCNKLLKQAFAIAKSHLWYDENYRSVLVK